jgi:hypothetical protein
MRDYYFCKLSFRVEFLKEEKTECLLGNATFQDRLHPAVCAVFEQPRCVEALSVSELWFGREDNYWLDGVLTFEISRDDRPDAEDEQELLASFDAEIGKALVAAYPEFSVNVVITTRGWLHEPEPDIEDAFACQSPEE